MSKCKKDEIPLPFPFNGTILACGAEMKSAPCLLSKGKMQLSEDLGHIGDADVYRVFLAEAGRMLDLCGGKVDGVACDMHPDYAATRYARTLPFPLMEVQHHHAHIVSCMADRQITGTVVGIAADGTGYGTDGTIWGCEVLICDESSFARHAHLRPFSLPGGDAGAVDTWRPAVALLADALGDDWFETPAAGFLRRIDARSLEVTRKMAMSERTARTSSLGRLFDAAAFLTGLCDRNETDAMAPIALQKSAESADTAVALEWELDDSAGDCLEMDIRPMIRQLAAAAADAADPAPLALGFHRAVAEMIAAAADRACGSSGQNRVVLSGGCFFNSLLANLLTEKLNEFGREVYNHDRISPGDPGVGVGQAVSCAARLLREEK